MNCPEYLQQKLLCCPQSPICSSPPVELTSFHNTTVKYGVHANVKFVSCWQFLMCFHSNLFKNWTSMLQSNRFEKPKKCLFAGLWQICRSVQLVTDGREYLVPMQSQVQWFMGGMSEGVSTLPPQHLWKIIFHAHLFIGGDWLFQF